MSLRTFIRQTLGLKASAKPKAKNTYPTTPSTGTYYEGMNQDYRWFRQDELTRKCITTNAYFATANGFETILESGNPDEYVPIKDGVDEINKLVNLDKILHDAQIKRSIHGRAAYGSSETAEAYQRGYCHSRAPRSSPNWTRAGVSQGSLTGGRRASTAPRRPLPHQPRPGGRPTGPQRPVQDERRPHPGNW